MLNLTAAWLRIALAAAMLVAGGAAGAKPATILVFGDSLSAEYGLPRGTGWVKLLSERLAKEAPQYSVVNASISGETTSGGRTRLPQLLQEYRPSVVVLQLGAPDGLRGLPLAEVRANFESLIRLSREAGAKVLLVGMRIPPNYGPAYANGFHDLYGELARKHKLPLVPFFLDGIALDDSLMLEDGLHPNAAAQPKLLDVVWPQLKPLLPR